MEMKERIEAIAEIRKLVNSTPLLQSLLYDLNLLPEQCTEPKHEFYLLSVVNHFQHLTAEIERLRGENAELKEIIRMKIVGQMIGTMKPYKGSSNDE